MPVSMSLLHIPILNLYAISWTEHTERGRHIRASSKMFFFPFSFRMYVSTISGLMTFATFPIISPSFEALYITNHLFPHGRLSSDEP